MVTPIRPIELMIGKTLPFALVGFFDVVLITVAALVMFTSRSAAARWLLLCRAGAVPAQHAGRRAVHLHHLEHPAAGHDGLILLLHAGRSC